jgi:hypothetical protein
MPSGDSTRWWRQAAQWIWTHKLLGLLIILLILAAGFCAANLTAGTWTELGGAVTTTVVGIIAVLFALESSTWAKIAAKAQQEANRLTEASLVAIFELESRGRVVGSTNQYRFDLKLNTKSNAVWVSSLETPKVVEVTWERRVDWVQSSRAQVFNSSPLPSKLIPTGKPIEIVVFYTFPANPTASRVSGASRLELDVMLVDRERGRV